MGCVRGLGVWGKGTGMLPRERRAHDGGTRAPLGRVYCSGLVLGLGQLSLPLPPPPELLGSRAWPGNTKTTLRSGAAAGAAAGAAEGGRVRPAAGPPATAAAGAALASRAASASRASMPVAAQRTHTAGHRRLSVGSASLKASKPVQRRLNRST
jgi:hypothetical protein